MDAVGLHRLERVDNPDLADSHTYETPPTLQCARWGSLHQSASCYKNVSIRKTHILGFAHINIAKNTAFSMYKILTDITGGDIIKNIKCGCTLSVLLARMRGSKEGVSLMGGAGFNVIKLSSYWDGSAGALIIFT